MGSASLGEEDTAPYERALQMTVALEGDGADIAQARHLASVFLTRVQIEYGRSVSQRALDLTRLVVSELVTNARKYAPGPVLLSLRVVGDLVEVVVWDSDPELPTAQAADAGRVSQHGLEIVKAVAQTFEMRSEPVGKRITARLLLVDDTGGAVCGRPSQ